MEIQYFVFIVIITFVIFLIAIGVQKTTKIFLWNYVAGFSAVISYLFIDYLLNYIWSSQIKVSNPIWVIWFITENKTLIIILIYFTFFVLFYKSRLFDVEINWFLKIVLWTLILPILTVANFFFTMLLIISGPQILTYSWYVQVIDSLNISQKLILDFFNIIPLIIILVPIFVLTLFLEIRISFPNIKKRVQKVKHTPEEEIIEEIHTK